MTIAELIAAGAMTTAPMFPSPFTAEVLPTYPGYYLKTNTADIVIGPGVTLTNGWIQFNPGTPAYKSLPGTPREGEVLTTEEVEVRPCFAVVNPACPGHAHTNLTRWRWASGAWNRVPETYAEPLPFGTNSIFWNGSPISATNLISTNSILWSTGATNVAARLLSKTGALVEKFRNLPPNGAPFGASPSDFIDLLDAFREDIK